MNKLIIFIFIYINTYAYDIQEIRKDFFHNVIEKQILKLKTKKEINDEINKRKQQSILNKQEIARYKKIIFKEIKKENIHSNEYFSIVNLKKQIYTILLYDRNIDKLYLIGSDLISSGNMKKETEVKYGEDHYFDTPIGVYEVKRGWRSDGKYKTTNKIIQSYGSKERFIYYFGNMHQKRYNSFKKRKKINNIKKYKIIDDNLNFAIHSYKNKNYKFGSKQSHGCVRMSDELNVFLDNNLVLHKNFFYNDRWKLKYSKKPHNIKNIEIKGAFLFIIKN